MNVELRLIDAPTQRHASWLTQRLYSRALKAYASGRWDFKIDDLIAHVTEATVRGMLGAHAKGKLVSARYRDERRTITAATERRRLLGKMTERDKSALSKLFGSIARSTTSSSMSKVKDALVGQLQASIRSGSRPKSDLKKTMSSLGLGKGSSHVVNTIVRTQTAMTFNAAVWEESMNDPEVWGFRLTTAGDERVRASHYATDGTVLNKRHKFWNQYAPPNGWNCRCGVEPVFEEEPENLPSPTPDIDAAFRFSPRLLLARGL